MNKRHALPIILSLVSGCAIHARPLSETPLRTERMLSTTQRTEKHILVLPFEDDRGPTWASTTPERYIPVVSWFHQSKQIHYPEQAGMLRDHGHHAMHVSTGAIGSALPVLLTRVMQQMGLGDSAKVDLGGTDASAYDYVVTGRVKHTRFREHDSQATALAFGILGVPFQFVRYDLEYEVALYDAHDRATPLFQHTYAFSSHRNIGLYYNHQWAYSMFVAGLEKTLPEVVGDLAGVLERRVASAL